MTYITVSFALCFHLFSLLASGVDNACVGDSSGACSDPSALLQVSQKVGSRNDDGKSLVEHDTTVELDLATFAEVPVHNYHLAQPGGMSPSLLAQAVHVDGEFSFKGIFKELQSCAGVMLVTLCLLLGILIWTQRGRFKNCTRTEMLANSCIVLYVAATIAVDVIIVKFHQQGGNSAFLFSPYTMTALIEFGKLFVMSIGACIDWRNTIECSFDDFLKTMQYMSIPAACFVTMNIGRYVALSGADLDQYRVWRSTDIIFVACIWFTVFKKTPGVKKIVGIGLVCLSCVVMRMQPVDKKSSGEVSSFAIMVILSLAFLSSLGLVMNEFGLKACTSMSLFVQNIALYLLTSVLNSMVVLAMVPTAQIFEGISSPQIGLIWLDVFLGICVACVLKYADAIAKQLASGWLAPLEPLVGHFLVGTPVTPMNVVATVFAGAGSIIYRLPDGKQEEKKEEMYSSIKPAAIKQEPPSSESRIQ